MRAAPRSCLSWSYELRADDGVVSRIDRVWFPERAEIAIRGESFVLEREGYGRIAVEEDPGLIRNGRAL